MGSECTGYSLGDPAMVLLNSIEQTRQNVTFYNSSFQAIQENYINISTKTADTSFVRLDGSPISSFGVTFQPLEANEEYAYATVQVGAGSHTLESSRCGLSVIVYGYGNVESYAYNGGANFAKLNTELPPLDACLGDPFSIDLGLNPDRYTFLWDFGDGNQSKEAIPSHRYEVSGTYDLSLDIGDACLATQTAFQSTVTVQEKEEIGISEAQLLCEGDSIFLNVLGNPGTRFQWRGPENFLQIPLLLSSQMPNPL